MNPAFELNDISELPSLAEQLKPLVLKHRVVAFHGEMGAGKTTLIKALCACLGVRENVSSPTFSLVNQYRTGEGKTIYHFDFYRINRESEAYDMGYEDYFYSQAVCLIEWPEKINALLPDGTLHITIQKAGDSRVITVSE